MNSEDKNVYTEDQLLQAGLSYFNGDELATRVWASKYALKEGEDYLELSPDDMHRRLAKGFWKIEKKYEKRNFSSEDEIFNLFKDFKPIVPQGRVMAGLGVKKSYRSLSNCLVLPSPEDSYSSIMYTDTMLVNAAKRGCGYGIDLSNLRPTNSITNNASNTSTGVVPFMERYSNSTREVGQEGRRGACLLGIDIKHPDSMSFATAKRDRTKVTGANISLKVDDRFMASLNKDDTYDLEFNGKTYDTVKAKEFWRNVSKTARDDAEPGIFFWDRMTEYDPVSVYEQHKIVLTNACGEQPMGALDSCRLLVVNLYVMISNPFSVEAYLDEEYLYDSCYKMMMLGDNLVDLEIEYIDRILDKIHMDPEPEKQKVIERELWEGVKRKAFNGRRVGAGLTGLGDMMAAMNLKYDSQEAYQLVEKVMKIKMRAELDAMIQLSKDRGPFPDWDVNLEYDDNGGRNSFYRMLEEEFPEQVREMKKWGRRNINWSTIAPTGSVSVLTQTSSGCEPVFQTHYMRRRKVEKGSQNVTYVDQNGDNWEEYPVLHHKIWDWWKAKGLDTRTGKNPNELREEDLLEYLRESPYHMSTANDIDWKKRIEIQGLLQKYTTSAISSTINLPEDVDIDTVEGIYTYAWKHGLKGVTIYREGSRTGVLVNKKKEEEDFMESKAPKRPKELDADYYSAKAKGKEYAVIVGLYKEKPYEIFVFENPPFSKNTSGKIIKVKKGHYKFVNGEFEIENLQLAADRVEERMLTLTASMLLRHGAPIKHVINVIKKIDENITSFSSVVRRYLSRYIDVEDSKDTCPMCEQETLIMEEGCKHCVNPECNYTAC